MSWANCGVRGDILFKSRNRSVDWEMNRQRTWDRGTRSATRQAMQRMYPRERNFATENRHNAELGLHFDCTATSRCSDIILPREIALFIFFKSICMYTKLLHKYLKCREWRTKKLLEKDLQVCSFAENIFSKKKEKSNNFFLRGARHKPRDPNPTSPY